MDLKLGGCGFPKARRDYWKMIIPGDGDAGLFVGKTPYKGCSPTAPGP
jgi:hypothetical protein